MAQKEAREVSIETPLGGDKLLLRRMIASEQLGRPYVLELELLSEDEKIKPDDLLGQVVTVRLATPAGGDRFFSGYVTRFALTGEVGRYAAYAATVRPWFWLLTRTTDCRIYSGTVLDIIKAAFEDFDFVDYDDGACDKGAYATRDFCVQYRETTFDFVSRLMEQEGIYYWFKHADGKATMMLCDSASGHKTAPGCGDVPYYPPTDVSVREKEHIHAWTFSHEIQPGKYALDDFDFEKPGADLGVSTSASRKHKISALEIFDYPGEYVEPGSAGKHYVKARLEELQAQFARARGAGDVKGLHVGGLIKMSNHPRDDQNKEYLVVSAVHDLRSNEYESLGGGDDETYAVTFEVLDSKEPFRAPRVTPLPAIRGPQTAIVVGQGGEEIWTDKYGRIKVQFHWDRRGKSDQDSSCWIRVAQVWAGKTWGGIHIPRIGQEVIVEFLEGDPDRPIVTGAVYNADQMPPYGLPDNATQSGLKSRSSKGGSDANFNEIRMEDKKGSEELYIHAEKNHTNITENDRKESVGHDRSLSVGNNKSENIAADKSITVGGSHSETISANKAVTVSGNHTESIGSNMVIAVAATLTEAVGVNYAEAVGGAMELAVGAAYSQAIGGKKSETVGGKKDSTIAGDQTETVNGEVTETYGKGHKTTVAENRGVIVDKEFGLEVKEKGTVKIEKEFQIEAKKVTIIAKDELGIEVGKAKITMSHTGDITIEGGAINIKGSGDLTMKAKTIAQN